MSVDYADERIFAYRSISFEPEFLIEFVCSLAFEFWTIDYWITGGNQVTKCKWRIKEDFSTNVDFVVNKKQLNKLGQRVILS